MFSNDTVITTVYNGFGVKMGTIYQDADGNMYFVACNLETYDGYEDDNRYF